MTTLPSLAKTWRFRVNVATAAGGTGLAACQNLLWEIKNALIGNGAWTDSAGAGAAAAAAWTVVRSSDSVTADATDRWTAAANLVWAAVGVAHSWIVLQQTGIGASFQLLIDCTNATPSNAYISVSPSGGFSAGSIQNRPTAADEVPILNASTWGGINAATASTVHILRSTDGKCNRVMICRSGFVSGYWCIDALNASWSEPWAGVISGDAGSATTKPIYGTLAGAGTTGITYTYRNGYIACVNLGTEYSRQFGYLGQQTVANDIGGGWPIDDMFAYSETPNNKGYLGKFYDQWWTSATLVDSDTFPVAGPTRNFCVFGDTVQPWNTTAPVFGGGVSTARDGEYMETPYYEDSFIAPIFASPYSPGGAPPAIVFPATVVVVYYLMQALDSVTGARYDWVARDTPDWAGVGYPGPNAPTDVAIAGVV